MEVPGDFFCYPGENGGDAQKEAVRGHIPVAHCQVGGHPIYTSHVSGADSYRMLNGKPICHSHAIGMTNNGSCGHEPENPVDLAFRKYMFPEI